MERERGRDTGGGGGRQTETQRETDRQRQRETERNKEREGDREMWVGERERDFTTEFLSWGRGGGGRGVPCFKRVTKLRYFTFQCKTGGKSMVIMSFIYPPESHKACCA